MQPTKCFGRLLLLGLFLLCLSHARAYDKALQILNSERMKTTTDSREGWSPLKLDECENSSTNKKTADILAQDILSGKIPAVDSNRAKILTYTSNGDEDICVEDDLIELTVNKILEVVGIFKLGKTYASSQINIKNDGTEQKLTLGKKLGSGNCYVYEAITNGSDSKCSAVKIDKQPEYLAAEATILGHLQSCEGVSKILGIGFVEVDSPNFVEGKSPYKLTALQLEQEGHNLKSLVNFCGQKFGLPTLLNILDQTIQVLEKIHNKNVFHKDIKPGNLVVNKPDYANSILSNSVKVIDFDASSFMEKSNQTWGAKSQRLKSAVHPYEGGTVDYMSIDSHNQKQYTRMDEIWSTFYSTMEFSLGELPWSSLGDLNDHGQMKASKEMSMKNFSKSFGYHGFEEFRDLLEPNKFFSTTLVNGTVNYSSLKYYIQGMRVKYLVSDNFSFDWNERVQMFFDRDVINIGIGCYSFSKATTVLLLSKFYETLFFEMNTIRKSCQALVIDKQLNVFATTRAKADFSEAPNMENAILEQGNLRTIITAKVSNPNVLKAEAFSNHVANPIYLYVGFGYYYCAITEQYFVTIVLEQEVLTISKFNDKFNKKFAINTEMTLKASKYARRIDVNDISGTIFKDGSDNIAILKFAARADAQTVQGALLKSTELLSELQQAALQTASGSEVGVAAEYNFEEFQWKVAFVFK